MTWDKVNDWERGWWGNCCNTFGEEIKQMSYATKMGLRWRVDEYDGSRVWLDVKDISVLDIGGGPISMLLKTRNVKGVVVDPCDYPQWTKDRYKLAGIQLLQIKGEEITPAIGRFDEWWIYNCLQHVDDPNKVVSNARMVSKLIRIIEPVNTDVNEGHPHCLTKDWLDIMLGGSGTSDYVSENGFVCNAYYGVFLGGLLGNPFYCG